jgi:hypothetical protein
MSIALPTLRGTAQQALYPFKRTIKCNTLVTRNQDGSRQCSILDNPRMLFDMPFTRLNPADKNRLIVFAASAVGQFETNESLTLGNVTYTNLSLDSDLYSGQVRATTMWDSSLKLTQTQAQALTSATTTLSSNALAADTTINVASVTGFNGYIMIGSEVMFITWTPDSTHLTVMRGMLGTTAASHSSGATVTWGPGFTLGADFPAFPNGCRTQIPWQQNQQYKTEVAQMEAGPKYTWAWYGGGLANFPLTALPQWLVGGDMLTDAETALLEAHFLANWGRFASFTFIDPETGVSYPNSYYTSDEMTIEYIQPNVNRVRLPIECYSSGSGGGPSGGGGGGGGGGGLTPVTATISILSTHIPGTGYDGNAAVSMGTGYSMFDPGAWTLRTDTITWSAAVPYWSASVGPLNYTSDPVGSTIAFFIVGTILGSASPPDKYLIYDCTMTVNYSDSSTVTYRPTTATVVPGQTSVSNQANAIDTDPTTYAEIDRANFHPFGTPAQLVLSHFA